MSIKISLKPQQKIISKEIVPTELEEEDGNTSKERGLLKVSSAQKATIHCLERELLYLQTMFLLPGIKSKTITEEAVWDYVQKFSVWVSCSSELYNVKSTVDWYENKKGERFKAHYTENGKYLRRMKAGEEDGVYYHGNFKLSQRGHMFKLNDGATTLAEMFVPRTA